MRRKIRDETRPVKRLSPGDRVWLMRAGRACSGIIEARDSATGKLVVWLHRFRRYWTVDPRQCRRHPWSWPAWLWRVMVCDASGVAHVIRGIGHSDKEIVSVESGGPFRNATVASVAKDSRRAWKVGGEKPPVPAVWSYRIRKLKKDECRQWYKQANRQARKH